MDILKNIPEDWKLALIKADNGDKNAMDFVECIKGQGFTDEDIREMKQQIYLPLAKRGNVDAMVYLAKAYAAKPNESYKWYYKAAMAGDSEAMWRIGMNYTEFVNQNNPECGYGIDEEKAKWWLLKAYEAGDSEGLRLLGQYCCEDGSSEQKNYLKQAAQEGNWEAMVDYIGVFYFSPEGKDGRYDKWLVESYLKAAQTYTADCDNKERLGDVFYRIGRIFGRKYIRLPLIKIPDGEDVRDAYNAVMYLSFASYLGMDCMHIIDIIVEVSGIKFNKNIYNAYCKEISNRYGI